MNKQLLLLALLSSQATLVKPMDTKKLPEKNPAQLLLENPTLSGSFSFDSDSLSLSDYQEEKKDTSRDLTKTKNPNDAVITIDKAPENTPPEESDDGFVLVAQAFTASYLEESERRSTLDQTERGELNSSDHPAANSLTEYLYAAFSFMR